MLKGRLSQGDVHAGNNSCFEQAEAVPHKNSITVPVSSSLCHSYTKRKAYHHCLSVICEVALVVALLAVVFLSIQCS